MAKIVEGRVGDEEPAKGQPHRPGDDCEQLEQLGRQASHVEQFDKLVLAEHQQEPHRQHIGRAEQGRVLQRLPHAVKAPRAPVLAEDRADRCPTRRTARQRPEARYGR